MGDNGQITELGQQYINDNSTTPSGSGPTFSAATIITSHVSFLSLALVGVIIGGLL